MENIKFYEFLLKLSTYLNRSNVLADKFANQEVEIGKHLLNMKRTLPKKVFDEIITPLANRFEDRVKIMVEIREANDGFESLLKEYYDYFKGEVQ